ncbi:MAG: hypothetical protein K9H64_21790 [Bacteroidales bacterium]|nr:hypothetical protein [Bacteroidales bacterium]MCF8458626.1 hypothetical protein [Bacteroidales bacterium]
MYTDKYVKNENVLVYSRNATIVPIQIMSMYYPPYACKVFEALEIPSPENFEKIVAQLHELAKKQK